MKSLTFLIVLGIMIATRSSARADDWKAAQGPLMTRWAKDVSPQNVHGEYPRPQMVRRDWLNLNGVWQFAGAALLVGLVLLCGWVQTRIGYAPPVFNLDEPSHAAHGHDDHGHH